MSWYLFFFYSIPLPGLLSEDVQGPLSWCWSAERLLVEGPRARRWWRPGEEPLPEQPAWLGLVFRSLACLEDGFITTQMGMLWVSVWVPPEAGPETRLCRSAVYLEADPKGHLWGRQPAEGVHWVSYCSGALGPHPAWNSGNSIEPDLRATSPWLRAAPREQVIPQHHHLPALGGPAKQAHGFW